jgi:F-type H+-transporting ATPase subunit epsilon
MLPDKIKLEIATPDSPVLDERVDEVVLPSVQGYMGVRPGHAPLLARLQPGEISFRTGTDEKVLSCTGGFAEVLGDAVSILATAAERADEIDLERAEGARERAEERLNSGSAEWDMERAGASLRRAVTRIRVHGRSRG